MRQDDELDNLSLKLTVSNIWTATYETAKYLIRLHNYYRKTSKAIKWYNLMSKVYFLMLLLEKQ